jgi:hypothetical protein
MVPVAAGLNLFVALLWMLILGWLIALHVQDRAMPTDALPILALLLVSITVTGWNWWALRRMHA